MTPPSVLVADYVHYFPRRAHALFLSLALTLLNVVSQFVFPNTEHRKVPLVSNHHLDFITHTSLN